MRCGAPIKTMHPPRRRRSDPSLRSASMALSERRRGQVSTSFRQPRTRNTPTSYQKHANFVPETSQRRPAFHLLRLLFGTPSRPRPLSESSEAPSAYPMALYGQGHSKGAPASLGFRAGFPFRSARLSFPFPFPRCIYKQKRLPGRFDQGAFFQLPGLTSRVKTASQQFRITRSAATSSSSSVSSAPRPKRLPSSSASDSSSTCFHFVADVIFV